MGRRNRPTRAPARRDGAKSDDLDAVRAAREALTREHLAAPRARGDREAMRVLLTTREGAITARTKAIGQLKALIVNAPQSLRDQLRRGTTDEQLNRCARLRTLPSHSVEHRATVRTIRSTARRALMLEAEAAEHETELELLVTAVCPQLLEQPGIGVITAAQFLISWSHRDRIRSEAAFAALAGAAPIPASSGATVRHRLNRAGDRQLNRALHTVALTRLRFEPTTKPTPRDAPPKERPPARSNAASNASSPARSTASCKPTRHRSRPSKRRLDRHRSILLIALGTEAAMAGFKVRYTLATKLVNELVEAADDKQLSKTIARYGRVDLLCIDELGYMELDKRGAELLFQVLTEREEKNSVAIASNESFSGWTKTFTDPRLCAAIVDRLTFGGNIIETGTDSFRLARTKAAKT